MHNVWPTKIYLIIVLTAAGLGTAGFWYIGGLLPGFGCLGVSKLVPAKGQPDSVAISPDGTQVAMMQWQKWPYGAPDLTERPGLIEVRDVRSGREVKTLSLPKFELERHKKYYFLSPYLSYCEGGKYLLALTGANKLDAMDAHNFQIHTSFALSGLNQHLKSGQTGFSSDVQFGCAADSGVAALAFWGSNGAMSIKLFDLDSGLDKGDLTGSYEGGFREYQGDGMAISPDGSKVALLTWNYAPDKGSGVDILDTSSGAFIKRLHLGDAPQIRHRLAFAGRGALIIGELPCEPNRWCDQKNPPSGRKLRVWNFGGDGSVRPLRWSGAET